MRVPIFYLCTALVSLAATARGAVPTNRIASADGVEIAYDIEGRGEPALVFIHGWAYDRRLWDAQVAAFRKTHRVIRLDLAGHGESGRTRKAWTMEAFGDDVAAVVRAAGLPRVVLVGHSMGALVALEAAARLKDRVAAVIPVDELLDAEARMPAEQQEAFLAEMRKDYAGTVEKSVPQYLFRPDSDPAVVQKVVAQVRAGDPQILTDALAQTWAYDKAKGMAAVSAPIRGLNADLQPTNVEVNRRYAPSYEAAILKGYGHYPMLENATAFNQELTGILAALGVGVKPPAALTLDVREWAVPWKDTRPRDPFMDAGGRVWFVGQVGDYLAHLDPATGKFTRVDLEKGTGPHNLVVDDHGAVWFAANHRAYIGRLDPASGAIKRYAMPDPRAEDPHTLIFDARGALWFTAQMSNFAGRLDPRTGDVRLVPMPEAGSRPYGIVVDREGRVYFNEFGNHKIGAIDPATLKLTEYPLADARTRGRRIGLTSDGAVWYTDYGRGFLGRLDPKKGTVREWALPAGEQSLPYAMAVDDKDRVWLVESGPQPNRFVVFDPATEEILATAPVPSGGGTVRHMVFVPRTREIWFGTDKDTVGRVKVP
jgi:virginiamycin B lyase